MKGTVNNGRRVLVRFGPYAGLAGVSDGPESSEVAFLGSARQFRDVKTGEIDGKAVTVTGVRQSDAVPSMVVVTAVTPKL